MFEFGCSWLNCWYELADSWFGCWLEEFEELEVLDDGCSLDELDDL
jgi:hypothetical protein